MRLLGLFTILLFATACQAETVGVRQISTMGYGEIKVQPDQALLQVTAKAQHPTSAQAHEEVNKLVSNYLAILAKQGIAKKDIVAATIHLQPRYEHRASTGSQFVGYEASRNIEITLNDLQKIGEILDLAVNSGIETINTIQYQSSQEDKHKLQAHKLAIADSQQKAASLAEAYHAKLGPIRSINYFGNSPGPIPREMAADSGMAMMRVAASPAVYLPDEITFSDQIQVVFDLEINQ